MAAVSSPLCARERKTQVVGEEAVPAAVGHWLSFVMHVSQVLSERLADREPDMRLPRLPSRSLTMAASQSAPRPLPKAEGAEPPRSLDDDPDARGGGGRRTGGGEGLCRTTGGGGEYWATGAGVEEVL